MTPAEFPDRGVRNDRGVRSDRVWIAWETQRRSLELSARLGAELRLCLDEDRGWMRHAVSAAKTWRILEASRGKAVFVQNPSMVLAALACVLKPIFGYHLIVDRHSNFGFLSQNAGLKRALSDLLSKRTLQAADLTIVTNPELAVRVERMGGRPFVLPDPFPRVPAAALETAARADDRPGGAPREILFVSSWAFDEPIAETIEACRALQGKVVVHITGRPKAAYRKLLEGAPPNFVTTGFLSDADYFDRMARCDAVMAITRRPCTLVCGAYEAIALGKPMVLGDTEALRDYFDAGAVYTDSSAPDLVRALTGIVDRLPELRKEVLDLRERRSAEWDGRLAALEYLADRGVAALRGREHAESLGYTVDAQRMTLTGRSPG